MTFQTSSIATQEKKGRPAERIEAEIRELEEQKSWMRLILSHTKREMRKTRRTA
jgi:hypothetical protein